MSRLTRRLLLAVSPALLLARQAAAHGEVRAGDLVITQGWSRAAGAGGQGAGFLTISNQGGAADRLLAASSPASGKMELHTHIRDGDVMRMREVPAIDIPAGQTVTLRPGGLHLMFMGLTQPLQQGQKIPVTLRFERAGEVRIELDVQAAGARTPGMQHRH
jgi:copper(I)-binding protein